MGIERYGNGSEGQILTVSVGDGDPLPAVAVSEPHDLRGLNITCAQLFVTGIPEQVPVADADDIDGSAGEWNFAGFDFTDFDGGWLYVANNPVPENNGWFPIVTGEDGTVETDLSMNHADPVDQTFDDDSALVTYVLAFPPSDIEGTWTVELSNDFVPANGGTSYGQPAGPGRWTDITGQFVPNFSAVDPADESSLNQYAQAELAARTIRFVFTRTTGGADGAVATAVVFSKSQG